jgi:Antibiotic biosynthesis monooxygenase
VIVVNRFRAPASDPSAVEALVAGLRQALDALAARPGHRGGTIGRNLDDPDLWLLTTTWENVGSYRRALSSYDVKVAAVPLLSQALDEPSAYEVVEPREAGAPGGEPGLNRAIPRHLD